MQNRDLYTGLLACLTFLRKCLGPRLSQDEMFKLFQLQKELLQCIYLIYYVLPGAYETPYILSESDKALTLPIMIGFLFVNDANN